jgi:hypothetical protein
MHPYHHSLSSCRKWGGLPEDYLPIHHWFDGSKSYFADLRHRALRHHAEGIFLCEELFGATLTNSSGRVIPVRWIGEQHVREDLGFIPTVEGWFRNIKPEPWMLRVAVKERDLDLPEAQQDDIRAEVQAGLPQE